MAEERTYVTMAGKSIGKCSSGHWLPLKGACDLCGATEEEKCRYVTERNLDEEKLLTKLERWGGGTHGIRRKGAPK